MDIAWILTIFAIGFVGSFISGMVGIGGSIIKYPMLLYIPSLLGFTAFTAHEVSGISAVQVFFASFAGVWAYRKGKYLNKSLIFYMGSGILIGSIIGSFGSSYFSEQGVNIVYGILALIAGIMMLIPKKQIDDIPLEQVTFNKLLATILSLIVGIGSGIVGNDRWFPPCTDNACRIKNTNSHDHCNKFSCYVYFIDRKYSRETINRASRLLASHYYGCRKYYCFTFRSEGW